MFYNNNFIQKYDFIFKEKVELKIKQEVFIQNLNSKIHFRNKINIVVKANNIFCTFSEIIDSKNKN